MEQWYHHHPIRSLVDMHIPNGEGYLSQFDPARYAENVKRSGATVAYLSAGSCLGLRHYPTDVGLRHREAERDIFGQTVAECRKRGLKVIAYTNTWATFVADEHPEWQVVYADGHRRRDKTRFGSLCVNNDAYVSYVCAHVQELISRYHPDGLWVDMIGICAPVCFCETCRRKYGKPLPRVIDRDDPALYEYLDYKAEVVQRYLETVRAAAKSIDPDITVAYQTAFLRHPLKYGLNLACLSASDYLAGDFYTGRAGVNTVCRMLYKVASDLPFEFMTSRCVDLEYHTMNKDIRELVRQFYASMMLGGAFLFIDAIDPDGTMYDEFYAEVAEISRLRALYDPYIDRTDKPVREVAVYYNFNSWLSPDDLGKSVDQMDGFYLYNRLEKICDTLCRAHIDHDLISPKNLCELSDYKLLILPSLGALSKEEAEAIRRYVANGGSLYVSGEASLRDEGGHLQDNFMLCDVFGADFVGRFDIKPNYIAPAVGSALFGRYTKKHPHMLRERMIKVKAKEGARVLATVTLPVSDSSDHLHFSSAISDPPMRETDAPALLENNYGLGRVVYSAGCVEQDPIADNEKLFTDLLGTLLGQPRVCVDAPDCVDHTLYEGAGMLKLHLLNHQQSIPAIPIADVCVRIRLAEGQSPRSVRDALGGEIPFTHTDGVLTLHTALEEYKLILIPC